MAMSDRELLELAAKAAGYELHFATGGGIPPSPWLRTKGSDFYWNPLKDVGQAITLANDLGLHGRASAHVNGDGSVQIGWVEVGDVRENFKGGMKERYAATCKAAVRAAAEIGKAMP